jgi:hypothetical protein
MADPDERVMAQLGIPRGQGCSEGTYNRTEEGFI